MAEEEPSANAEPAEPPPTYKEHLAEWKMRLAAHDQTPRDPSWAQRKEVGLAADFRNIAGLEGVAVEAPDFTGRTLDR